jgi:hypothetical protein
LRLGPFAVRTDASGEVQPDVIVARYVDLTNACLPVAPLPAVEVVSASTALYDRNTKKAHYERIGVRSYWLPTPTAPATAAVIHTRGLRSRDVTGVGCALSSSTMVAPQTAESAGAYLTQHHSLTAEVVPPAVLVLAPGRRPLRRQVLAPPGPTAARHVNRPAHLDPPVPGANSVRRSYPCARPVCTPTYSGLR